MSYLSYMSYVIRHVWYVISHKSSQYSTVQWLENRLTRYDFGTDQRLWFEFFFFFCRCRWLSGRGQPRGSPGRGAVLPNRRKSQECGWRKNGRDFVTICIVKLVRLISASVIWKFDKRMMKITQSYVAHFWMLVNEIVQLRGIAILFLLFVILN